MSTVSVLAVTEVLLFPSPTRATAASRPARFFVTGPGFSREEVSQAREARTPTATWVAWEAEAETCRAIRAILWAPSMKGGVVWVEPRPSAWMAAFLGTSVRPPGDI